MKKIDLGNHREAAQPECIKALIVEFITTFFFVFAGVGSAMATGNLFYNTFMFFVTIWSYQVSYWLCTCKSNLSQFTLVFLTILLLKSMAYVVLHFIPGIDSLVGNTLVGLLAVAVALALVVAVMISAGHISGGHLNPAVTIGLLFGGHISVFRAFLYWIDQLLASSAACFLLSYLTGGMVRLISPK